MRALSSRRVLPASCLAVLTLCSLASPRWTAPPPHVSAPRPSSPRAAVSGAARPEFLAPLRLSLWGATCRAGVGLDGGRAEPGMGGASRRSSASSSARGLKLSSRPHADGPGGGRGGGRRAAGAMRLRGGWEWELEDEVFPHNYTVCAGERAAAGEFAELLEHFVNQTNDNAKEMFGPLAVLNVPPEGGANDAVIIFSSEWFRRVLNRSQEELAGQKFVDIAMENATAMKKRHWQLITEEPCGLATRFPFHHPVLGEILMAMHAEPVMLYYNTEKIHWIGVAINDVTGMEEGISIRDFPENFPEHISDVIQGMANKEDTLYRRTIQTCFDFLEHLVLNTRTVVSDALIHAFPNYHYHTTVLNQYKRWHEMREQLKGPSPNFTDPAIWTEDNLYNEDVDAICEELGEWYREYRAENIKKIAELDGTAGQPVVDTCAVPDDTAENSVQIASRLLDEAKEAGQFAEQGVYEDEGLRLPEGFRSTIDDVGGEMRMEREE